MSFALETKSSPLSTSSTTARVFGYCTHAKASQTSITTRGLLSTYARTGLVKADPEGSFAKDRLKRETKMQKDKLSSFLAIIYACGGDPGRVVGLADTSNSFIYSSAGDITKATEEARKIESDAGLPPDWTELGFLSAATKIAFEAYCSRHHFKTADLPPSKLLGDFRTKNATLYPGLVDAIFGDPMHYLTRLAKLSVSFSFDLEELQTAQNIYFTLISVAVSQIKSYAALHGGMSGVIVLRVDRTSLPGSEADPADGNAIRTRGPVPATIIEIYTKATLPTNEELIGSTDWRPLAG